MASNQETIIANLPAVLSGFSSPNDVIGDDAASSEEDYSSSDDSDSDSDSSSGSSCSDSSFEDDELLAQTLGMTIQNPIRKSRSTPSLANLEMTTMQVSVLINQIRMSSSTPSKKKISKKTISANKASVEVVNAIVDPPKKEAILRRSSFAGFETPMTTKNVKSRIVKGPKEAPATNDLNPSTLLENILKEAGMSYTGICSKEINDYFVPVTEDRVNAYSADIIGAVKSSDITTLRKMHFEQKINLNCCNRFGESVLHSACRRGLLDVVKFLVVEAKVDLRVRDDFGRTPMHDACWTADPNMDILKLLMTQWPDLLFVKDKRNFTPLQYVRKAHWPMWCKFVRANKELLINKMLKAKGMTMVASMTA